MQKDDLDFIKEIIKIAVPTVGAIIAVAGFWGQLNGTLIKHTDAIDALAGAMKDSAAQAKACSGQLAEFNERLGRVEATNHQIMWHLHISPNESPHYTVWPDQGSMGKRQSMPPETQAPAVGAMKGHALFVPEPVAHTEPPQNAGDFDDVVRIQQEAWK